MKKKKILLTLGIAAMMGLAGCGETPTDPQTPVDPPVVTVDPVVTGITLKAEGDKTTLEISQTLKFTATVTGEGDFNKQYTFSVDKEDIGVISNEGVLTAKKAGTVVVTATAAGDTTKKSSITITVTAAPVSKIKDVAKDRYVRVVGKVTSVGVGLYFVDDGTGPMEVYYGGYDHTIPEDIALGKVVELTGVAKENYGVIEFDATSGKDEYFTANVSEETIETTTLDGLTATDAAGYDAIAKTITKLTPIKFRATALEGLEFKVDDTSTEKLHVSYATDATKSAITVGVLYDVVGYMAPYHTKNSYNQLYVASVSVVPIAVTSITVNAAGGATSMGLNETLQMSVTIAPEKATNKGVTWSVDKEDVATIDENGLLTSKTAGTVVVTATAKDGSGVSGTKSIEVLQFKDPVVSLTLGEAPSETVLGDADIDVTVTVAGESSTSNFNPAYTATSSDEQVAKVTATETGIKIHAVAAGLVTITVKTTGTNAAGEQLTKTIDLTVLGEPKVKKMTVSEAMNWRPTDPSATYTDKSQLVEITGVCDYTNVSKNFFYISDDEGGSIEGYKLFSDGEFAYDTASHEYSFTKGGEATAIKTDLNMKGKEITIKGTLCYYKDASTGAITMEVTGGTFTVGEVAVPTIVDATKDTEGGSYEIQAEGLAFDSTVTINNIAPAAGYKLGSVVIDQAYTIYNPKSFTDNGDGTSKITFKACNYNKVEVNFVPDDGLAAKTVAEAVAIGESLQLLNNRNPISGYVRVTGVLDSIADLAKGNFVLSDEADDTKAITVYGASALKDLLDAGQAGIGYKVTLDVQIQNYGGTLELINAVNVTADPDGIAGYTITKGDAENGEIASIKIGENEVTGPVAPGTVVTVTLLPDTNYKSAGLEADNCAIVTKDALDDNVYTVKIFGDTNLTPRFEKNNSVAATKTIAQLATALSWVNGTKYGASAEEKIALDAVASFYCTGGGNTGKYYTSGNEWRIYQNESPTVNIVLATGYELKSVTITYNISNSGVLQKGTTNISSGVADLTVSGATATYTVGNTGSATNGQVKVTAITVVYGPIE